MKAEDFAAHYSRLGTTEFLLIAADRDALTDEARSAIDAELRRRKLTANDADAALKEKHRDVETFEANRRARNKEARRDISRRIVFRLVVLPLVVFGVLLIGFVLFELFKWLHA